MALTFLQEADDGTNGSSFSFSAQNLGTASSDRYIIVAVTSKMSGTTATTISSVTVGGIAATIAVQRQNGISNSTIAGLAIAAVPSGTSGTVAVSFTNSQVRCGIALYRATGLTSATATATASSTAAAPTSGSMTISGGYAIGAVGVSGDATTSTAWTNGTENYDTLVESLTQISGAHAFRGTTTITMTATFTNGGAEPVGVFATWPATSEATSVTVAANTASVSIKPTANNATVTVAANNATVSYVAPPRSLVIDGTDYIADTMWANFSLTECANRGEVGTGGFDTLDPTSVMSIPALRSVVLYEPAAGGANRQTFTGFTHDRTIQYITDASLSARMWGVETTDLNILASDYVLADADSADRASETDYARVVWLLTTVFGTTGNIGSGVVPNSNTVTMEATDYRGRKPADVLAECSEASGKLWFIYDYGSGRKLYYDVATGTSLSSSSKISDVDADTDGSTVFAPIGNLTKKVSPDRIYSKVHLTYNGGTVTVSNGTTATTYRAREASVLDASISDSTLATTKANALLNASASEITEIEGLTIIVPAANLNDIRAGQRVQIKLTRMGIAAYTYFRVIRRTIQPTGTAAAPFYQLGLGLASDVLASANGSRGGDDIWPNKSNANDDGATVIVDRGGITVTNGALTLTDEFGSTVMQSTGFTGTWADFIRLGLYNARFQNALAGAIQTGRTSDLPFWTKSGTGSGTVTGLAGGGVTITWSSSSDNTILTSDKVPVQPGGVVEAAFAMLSNRAAGNLTINVYVHWYKYDGTASATTFTNAAGYFGSTSVTTLLWIRDALVVPTDALYATIRFETSESSHNAANSVSLYAAKLQDIHVQLTPYLGIAQNTAVGLSPGSGTVNNYDPGDDSYALLQLAPSAALSLTGLVAPTGDGWRQKYIHNRSAFAITLKNENAGSTAANRFTGPGAADYVVGAGASVQLLYNPTDDRWTVVA